MGRPERILYPDRDPLHAFAARLRRLREDAGRPKYDAMARRTDVSKTALSEAAGGDHLPDWKTVDAFVRICGGDPADFLAEWESLREARSGWNTYAGPRWADPAGMSNLPRRPTSGFLGRDEIMAELTQLLDAGRSSVIGPAVHGLGGIGKSELALQYAYEHRDKYSPTWWVSADTADNLALGLAALTRAINLDWPATASLSDSASWAVRWLDAHQGWLLVLDNVIEPLVIQPVLAAASRGSVIATSRRDIDWSAVGLTPLRVPLLVREASVQMLLARSDRQIERGDAELLAAELADLPLALSQAAAYLVERRHVSVREYVRRLRKKPQRVLSQAPRSLPADDAVARTWRVTVEGIAAEDPAAARLLDIVAYLAPDRIPIDLLLADGTDESVLDDHLALIASYSMVARTESAVSIHRLVQAAIRANHTDAGPWHGAVQLLTAALPPGDPEAEVPTWPRWSNLAPHVESVTSHLGDIISLGIDEEIVEGIAQLIYLCAMYHRGQGRYQTTITFFQQSLDLAQRLLGPEHPVTVTASYGLAGGYWSAGRYLEAVSTGESILETRRRLLGPEHPDTLLAASYLAIGYREIGRHDEAMILTKEALEARVRVLGPEHPDTLRSRNNLAGCYRALHRFDEAIALDEETLEMRTRVLGAEHPDTLQSRNNLAGGYRAVGRFDKAIALDEETLAERIRILGREHPDTLHSQHNLATSYLAVGRFDEAMELDRNTLAARESLLGPDHLDTQESRRRVYDLK